MPTFEHATSIGVWNFRSLVESSKLRQMTFNEEAGHRNKAQSRVHLETNNNGVVAIQDALFDDPFVCILQGVHAIADEAAADPETINAYIPYPTGTGLPPFVRRPIPVVGALRGVLAAFPGSPSLDNLSFRSVDFDLFDDFPSGEHEESFPEATVGVQGIDAVTDFRTSLVITHRWSQNALDLGNPSAEVDQGGYLFWRVIGHVSAY